MRQWLREPLLHFLLVALLLYGVFGLLHPGQGAGPRVIRVDRKALLDFLQYRSQAFSKGAFDKAFDALDASARQALIDDYVREEVLVREARSLGLADGDNVIRQRLVQRLGFVLEDATTPRAAPDDAELESWYRAHSSDYHEPATYTFTHVFFDREVHGATQAEALARRTAVQLRASKIAFADAARYGDRFPYLLNYVERTSDFVQSQFGGAFLASLDALPADGKSWQGPIASDHGWHLVLLTQRVPARLPPLSAVHGRVLEDWKREQTEVARRSAVQRLVDRYRVERVGLDVPVR